MADLALPRSTTDFFGDPIDDSSPLLFKASSFLSPSFDPEVYIADLKSFVPLESLAKELRSHLASLKSELVDLINRDYADFVSLSTRLVDVDSAVSRMWASIVESREKVAGFRDAVDSALGNLREGLRQRAEAAAAREVLELLLDTFYVVSKVEKLIEELPSMPVDGSTVDIVHAENGSLINDTSSQHTENEKTLRETQSILLERIASEMNRLKFYISHVKNLPFIENMEKRIQSATFLLVGSLGHCFVNGLEHRDATAIYNCLRAYAAIDNTSTTEEIFRTTVVAPLIQKIIPYGQIQVVDGASSDELEEDYRKIKQCIEKDCKFLLEISSSANSGLHVFDFLANSILKEVLLAIQKGKPGAFSPGRPTEFLKNYKSSLGFLAFLEGYCPSRSAVSKLRSEAVYTDFMRQWNVGVYFSLRFQEIAGSLDYALMGSAITPVDNKKGKYSTLTLKQSIALMESLRLCWSDDVLVISCSDKFLRLSLQLLSRYSNWLSSGLVAWKGDGVHASTTLSSEWAIAAHLEDFIYVMHDVHFLVTELTGDYLGDVLRVLESCSAEVLDLVKQSILQAKKSLEECLPAVIDTLIETIVKKSVEDLRQLKGITATYRMTNKLPVRHSPYVSGVLRPLKTFLDGEHINLLTKETVNELLFGAAERITSHYYELAADVVNVARKTESSLLRLRQGAQRRVGASSDALDSNVSDTDKIVEPYKRGTASTALASEYFKMKPCACEPSSLPKYPPNKEIDAKSREESRRKRISRVASRVNGSEAARRPSKTYRPPQESNGTNRLAAHPEESRVHSHEMNKCRKPDQHRVNSDPRLLVDLQPLPSINPPYDNRHPKHGSQGDLSFSGPLHVNSSSGFAWVKKPKDELPIDRSHSKSISRRYGSSGALDSSNIIQQKNALESKGRVDRGVEPEAHAVSRVCEHYEIAKQAMLKKWAQLEHPDSFSSSELFHSQEFSRGLYMGDVSSKRNDLSYQDQEDRVEFSGPLFSQSHKVDELLQKRERHIRQAVRRSWFQRVAGRKQRK